MRQVMQIARNRLGHCLGSAALLVGATLWLSIGLAGCQVGTTSANGGGHPPVPDATVSFCDDGDGACAAATSFSVGAMRDLVVNVNWENLPAGHHTQLLEVLQPGGGLYQASQTSFLVEDSSQSAMTISRTLPVAGAWISQRQITGEWSVRVSLDGSAITTQAVELNP
jgi:hypothetical protein